MKCAIIMAGGKGTRMKATCPKVMCNVLFEPMISYVVDAVKGRRTGYLRYYRI